MDLKISQKTAFISGSTTGIGFATAKALAQEGAKVVLNGRSSASVHTAIDRLQELLPEASISGVAADFANREEVQNLLTQLPEIDILINNVGIYSSQSFEETPDEDWMEQYEVNVLSGVRLSRKLLPNMLDKNWGRIVFISSECASLVPEDLISYSATKAAMLAVSRGLAQLTKGKAVTVNALLPGSTLTEGAEAFLDGLAKKEHKSRGEVEQEFFAKVRTHSLIQRFAQVEEVAHTIVYLCSPLAAAINGSAIKVDGGSIGGIL